ncbi:DUF1269 domain-containing protein [Seongchinamella sediminis]|uniref:DUF1269 domain-containing protein n=1 Tax=Seongchinamella sediminis TaxID=2283635 RepID=A0A3L7E052_9GAMM|nr:DUF1269 domain-containing protein [Seongchinamella sediminis]RLQ21763.1 DUF1269 domain-containing protein [Seongchinamella sediminis]
MKQRYFFFVSTFADGKQVIEDLKSFGVSEDDLHVIANDEVILEPLPEADITHRSDVVQAAKRGAATGGAMGLLGSLVAVTVPPAGLTLGGGAILAGTALGTALGTWFSTLVGVSVPNQEVEDYRERIDRGELMVIVDCEPDQHSQLAAMLESRHSGTLLQRGNLDAA